MAEAWHRYPFDLMVEDILNLLAWAYFLAFITP